MTIVSLEKRIMYSFYSRLLLVLGAILAVLDTVQADNPIIQSIYTADPAPVVVGDRIYLLADHDENGSTTYNMKDWRLFSTAVSGLTGQQGL
jgi:arabinoxylan arabinofuranohydrolase